MLAHHALRRGAPRTTGVRGVEVGGLCHAAPHVLHRPILTAALLVLLVFGFLTGYVIVTTGFGPLEAVSLLVLGLFAFGVVGALRLLPE